MLWRIRSDTPLLYLCMIKILQAADLTSRPATSGVAACASFLESSGVQQSLIVLFCFVFFPGGFSSHDSINLLKVDD